MPTWLYMKWDRVTPPVQHRSAKPARPPAAVRAGRPKSLVGSGSLRASKSASRPLSAARRASNLPTRAIPPRTSEKDSAATRSFGRSTVFPFDVLIIYVRIQTIKILSYPHPDRARIFSTGVARGFRRSRDHGAAAMLAGNFFDQRAVSGNAFSRARGRGHRDLVRRLGKSASPRHFPVPLRSRRSCAAWREMHKI